MTEQDKSAKTKIVLSYAGRIVPPEFCANWSSARKYDVGVDLEGHQGTLSILSAHDQIGAVLITDIPVDLPTNETLATAVNTIQNILDWTMAAQTLLTKFSIGLTQGEWFVLQNDNPVLMDAQLSRAPIPTPDEPTPWVAVKLAFDMARTPFLQYAVRDFADGIKLQQAILQHARSLTERSRQKDVLFYIWRAAEWVARGFTDPGRRNADIRKAEITLGLPHNWIDNIGDVAHPLVRHGEKPEPISDDVLEAAIERVRGFILRYAQHLRQEPLPSAPQEDALSVWLG